MAGLLFNVFGVPAPQGSKRAFVNRYTGRAALVESSAKVRPWREAVKFAALAASGPDTPALVGAVTVRAEFFLPRPKGHYGTGRNADLLRPSAPSVPFGKPDVDKLVRSTLDALTDAGVWGDDGQVAALDVVKLYADSRGPGARIGVREGVEVAW